MKTGWLLIPAFVEGLAAIIILSQIILDNAAASDVIPKGHAGPYPPVRRHEQGWMGESTN